MEIDHLLLGDQGVALVDAVLGAAIGQEVLGGGCDLAVLDARRARRTLQAAHIGGGVFGDDLRPLGITFEGAAPAIVLRD
jgi:hypothetical protein